MPTIIRRMFSKRPRDYDLQKSLAQSTRVKDRLKLAKDSGTHKEILYYLAENDPDARVRAAVVKNAEMPVQASNVLAVDHDQDVRLALAGRLVDLLPDLSQDKHSQLYAFAVQALGTLALDEVLKVRVALSSTLKDHAFTPPKVAGQLARDVEREVSEPILRYCTALGDADLIDILKSHPASWVVEAVARRDRVSADVSKAVIDVEDVSGGKALIENEGADLTAAVLQSIVERARDFPEWQKPIAVRKSLPPAMAKTLASFVDASIKDLLILRGDFDAETVDEISDVFQRRMEFAGGDKDTPVELRLKRLIADGRLDEALLSDALAMNDYDLVIAALAYLAKTSRTSVQKIMDMKAAKPIVALTWKAGLSMRMALKFQQTIGKVQPKEQLYPKDGSDYPLSEDDLIWQLEFLGVR